MAGAPLAIRRSYVKRAQCSLCRCGSDASVARDAVVATGFAWWLVRLVGSSFPMASG